MSDPGSRADEVRDLAFYLDRVVYPANHEAVLATARRLGAEPEIMEELAKLPPTITFESSQEAFEAIGG